MNFFKSLSFTILALLFGILVVAGVAEFDESFGLESFQTRVAAIVGIILILLGAVLRFWPTYLFYQKQMRVISLKPQQHLITEGPYKFTRNPLYLGMILILLGTSLVYGSWSAIILILVVFLVLNFWAGVEERQLASVFGEEYLAFRRQVRRWL